jgi:lipopolysaccharide transport system ATP-binding protein
MSDVAIRAEHLSKQYVIGGQKRHHDTLRDRLTQGLKGFSHRRRQDGAGQDTFWALKDISFEIGRGEVVGVIGRNGAGKSTLLKILSRITEPTKGLVDVYGRVGSLLEVGTGFHPELSGRENIYLNGAMLGMSRQEISRKFDEIVAFAEVEKFIDMPVKRYSSGMYVRLAFAVAAHLEPEILVVDEVLAVGDAAFQKKCLGKMGDVAKEGRTILFVSHDMTNISVLCQSAMLLESGRVKKIGPPQSVIAAYIGENAGGRAAMLWTPQIAPGDDAAKLWSVRMCKQNGPVSDSYFLREPIEINIEYEVLQEDLRLNPVVVVKNAFGVIVFSSSNYEDAKWGTRLYKRGRYRATCIVPAHILNDGTFIVDVMLVQETRFVRAVAEHAVEFTVHDDGSTRGDYVGQWVGVVRPRCLWDAQRM